MKESPLMLMTASRVMEKLNVKEVTLWRWRRDGTGPRSMKMGPRVMYDAADVETFVSNGFTKARIESNFGPVAFADSVKKQPRLTREENAPRIPVIQNSDEDAYALTLLRDEVRALRHDVDRLKKSRDVLVENVKRLKRFGVKNPEGQSEDDGFVYVISDDSGKMKIGKTGNLYRRLSSMKTVLPDLRIVVAFRGYTQTEKTLHSAMSRHRLKGEWFTMSEESKKELSAIARRRGLQVVQGQLPGAA